MLLNFSFTGEPKNTSSPEHGRPKSPVGNFNDTVQLLAQYLKTVLEPLPFAIYWTHRGFWHASSSYLSYDCVHLNREGQHKLFKSIRGAVMSA